jgi:hypothetical protein
VRAGAGSCEFFELLLEQHLEQTTGRVDWKDPQGIYQVQQQFDGDGDAEPEPA